MPVALENCVASLQAKWKSDPKSRPTPRDPKQDEKSQAYAICTATLKKKGAMSDADYYAALADQGDGDIVGRVAILSDLGYTKDEAIELALASRDKGSGKLEGFGPAIVGVALTIKPFIKRQERASILEAEDGRQVMRIPVMRKGTWRHPVYGVLRFDDGFFGSVISNFQRNVYGQDVPVKDGHRPQEQHALGWVQNVELQDDRFVVLADPTDSRGVDIIKSKKAPYASAEFVFDYKDTELKTLSLEGIEETDDTSEGVYEFSESELAFIDSLSLDECAGCTEDKMSETNEPTTVQLSAEEFEALEMRLAQLDELAGRLAVLSGEIDSRDTRIAELESLNEAVLVDALVEKAKAYRDRENRGHSAIFLNAYEAALSFGEIVVGDEVVVTLSEDITPETVRDYFRGILRFLAETMPGVVPFTDQAVPQDVRDLADTELPENYGSDLWESV